MVLSASITHDEKYIISSSLDHTIRVWRVSNGNLMKSLYE